MKIAYVANHGNGGTSDDTEGHIAHALRGLGHEVVEIFQTGSPAGIPHDADLLLFHHWYNVHLGFFEQLPMPKVCWYFDKVWNGRDVWLRQIAPLCARVFLTDGTWALTAGIPNLRVLRQGIGDRDPSLGTPRPDRWKAKIAFTGANYGERANWAKRLTERYGEAFQVIQGVHNRDLYDLAATVPIFVAPPFPADDFYWSNRIYLLLGSGAFLIHPRLAGLTDEYVEGTHYVAYGNDAELDAALDFYGSRPERRRAIAEAGYRQTHDAFSFTRRCQKLLSETPRRLNTGTSG